MASSKQFSLNFKSHLGIKKIVNVPKSSSFFISRGEINKFSVIIKNNSLF